MEDITEDHVAKLRAIAERIDAMRAVDDVDAEVINEAANEMESLREWNARLSRECREQFKRVAELEASMWRDPGELNAAGGGKVRAPFPYPR